MELMVALMASSDKGAGWIFVFIILIIIFAIVMAKEKENSNKEKINKKDSKIKFYRECVHEGISSFDTEKNMQKAGLIAQKYKLEFSSIEQLYLESKELNDKACEIEKAAINQKKQSEETNELRKLERYSEYYGRDKRVAMLTEKYAEASRAVGSGGGVTNMLISSTTQKEMDWAVHGGIASGIAGPAAGVATAMDIQQKNAQIRQQNKENREKLAPVIATAMMVEKEMERDAKRLEYALDAAKTKLVSNMSADECLSRIDFSDTTFEVAETGSITVTANAKLKTDFCIFDDVEAVIDGTVIAQIYDGNSLIGEAKMVLPVYGLKSNSYSPLKGMSLSCGVKGKPYLIFFKPYKLWAMEK